MTAIAATPDRAASWTERAATIGIFLTNGFGIGAWAASIASIKSRFLLSDGSLSLVLFAFAVGAVLSMPAAGLLSPRLGSGPATRIAAATWAAALLLPFLAPNYFVLMAASFVLGVTGGGLDVSMNIHASSVERRWGAAIMSSFHACWSLACLLGAGFAAVILAAGADPSLVLIGAAIVCAVLTLATWSALGGGEVAVRATNLMIPGRAALPLCAAVLLAMLSEGAIADWSGVYFTTVVKVGISAAAAGYATFAGAMLAGRIFGDGLVRMLGQRRIMQVGGAMSAAGLLTVAAFPAQLPCVIGFAVAGIGLANIVPTLFSAGGRLGATPAAGVAMAATAGYAGHLSGPPIMGAIAMGAGLQTGMVVLAGCGVVIALLASASTAGRS